MKINLKIKNILFAFGAFITIASIFFILTYTKSSDRLLKQGIKYFKQERYHEALPFFISVFNADSENLHAAIFLLRTYEALGMKESAGEMLNVIWRISPEEMTVAEELADFRYSLCDYFEAEKIYRVIMSKKLAETVKRKLAEVLVWQKKYDEASRMLEELAREKPADCELAEFSADVLVWAEKYDTAVNIYKTLLLRNYHSEEIVLKLADVLRFAGRGDEAIQIYNEYLKEKGR